jgi:hypothetical protein
MSLNINTEHENSVKLIDQSAWPRWYSSYLNQAEIGGILTQCDVGYAHKLSDHITEHPILPPGTFDDYKATILHEDAEWNKFVKEAKVADHPELTEQKRLDAIRPPKYDALLRANFASAMIT